MTDHKAHTLTLLPDEVLRIICSYLMQVPKYQRPRSADEDSDDEDADVTEETETAWARFQRTQYLGVRAVVALSKTSRTLSQHALDALWRSLPGYGPLVFTLPESAYKVETVQCPRALLPWNKPPSQHISITRPLVDSDFVRFRHYAHRVHRIICLDRDEIPFHDRAWSYDPTTSVLEAFAAYSPHGPPLLPNLYVLQLYPKLEDFPTLCCSMHVLYTTKLTYVQLGHLSNCTPGSAAQNATKAYDNALHKLTATVSKLRHLSFNVTPWYPETAQALSRAIPKFRHLTSIYATPVPITLDALLHLGKLPALRNLTATIFKDIDVATLALFKDSKLFLRVRYLYLLHHGSLSVLVSVLRSVGSMSLHKLTIIYNNYSSNSPLIDVEALLSTVAKLNGRRRIKKLSIELDSIDISEAVPTFPYSTIKSLYKLSGLHEFVLDIPYPFPITNSMLRDMGEAWPHMKSLELKLPIPEGAQGVPPATLCGLVVLAHFCPLLTTLAVPFNPDIGALPRWLLIARPSLGLTRHPLQFIKVGRSKIADPVPLAAFLSDAFPRLQDVDCDWPFEDDAYENEDDLTREEFRQILADAQYRDRWQEAVWTLHPKFVKARKQERRWATENGIGFRPMCDLKALLTKGR